MNFIQAKLKQISSREKVTDTAGAELLSWFLEQWQSIQSNSLQAAAQAKELSSLLAQTAAMCKCQEEKFNKLYTHLQALPEFVKELEKVSLTLEKLESDIEETTCAIDLYEKVCNDYELCKKKQALLQEVNDLKISKRKELEKAKEALARKHAEQLLNVQEKQELIAAKREEALMQALISEGRDT